MRNGNDLNLDDVVQHDGRLWRIDDKQVSLHLELVELRSDGSAPCRMILDGDPEEAKFSPMNLQRLDPEAVPGEPE